MTSRPRPQYNAYMRHYRARNRQSSRAYQRRYMALWRLSRKPEALFVGSQL